MAETIGLRFEFFGHYMVEVGQPVFQMTYDVSGGYVGTPQRPQTFWCYAQTEATMIGPHHYAVCFTEVGNGRAMFHRSLAGPGFFPTEITANGYEGRHPRVEPAELSLDGSLMMEFRFVRASRQRFEFNVVVVATNNDRHVLGRVYADRTADGTGILSYLGHRMRISPGADRNTVDVELTFRPRPG